MKATRLPRKTNTNRIQSDVLAALLSERKHQLAKWPGHRHCVAEWIIILRKLMRDAEGTWMAKGDFPALHEIRQVAQTAIAAMEMCGAPLREEVKFKPGERESVMVKKVLKYGKW